MALSSVSPPFPVYTDRDGAPLDAGFIYIGQPGLEAQSNPKASFFDAALTVPTGTASGAAVRTLAGYPSRNGAATMLYVDGDYSITIRDAQGVLVFSALNRTFELDFLSGGPSGIGSGDMQKVQNLAGLASITAARTNLGLGTAATINVSTLGAQVMQAGTVASLLGLIQACPVPITTPGIGQFQLQYFAPSVDVVLPTPGRWAWILITRANPSSLLNGVNASVGDAGTTILAGASGQDNFCILLRVA